MRECVIADHPLGLVHSKKLAQYFLYFQPSPSILNLSQSRVKPDLIVKADMALKGQSGVTKNRLSAHGEAYTLPPTPFSS
jgi:hypothetical protein